METIEWIATVLGLIGAMLIALKKRTGFKVWLASNAFMIIFSILSHHWGVMIQFIAYSITSIIGLIKWEEDNVS